MIALNVNCAFAWRSHSMNSTQSDCNCKYAVMIIGYSERVFALRRILCIVPVVVLSRASRHQALSHRCPVHIMLAARQHRYLIFNVLLIDVPSNMMRTQMQRADQLYVQLWSSPSDSRSEIDRACIHANVMLR